MSTDDSTKGAWMRIPLDDGRVLCLRLPCRLYLASDDQPAAVEETPTRQGASLEEQPRQLPKWPRALSLHPDLYERRN